MKFKPMLAPNDEPDLANIKYPILASYKLDGIRCIFYKGEMLSRSLKPIQNKQLQDRYQALKEYTRENDLILDGEFYSPDLTFQEITRFVMTQDFEDARSVKKYGKVLEVPEHLKFHAFDAIGTDLNVGFHKRLFSLALEVADNPLVQCIKNTYCGSKEEVQDLFDKALADGYEGLILRSPDGRYKCGRGTLKEGLIYKLKPFRTFDAVILGVGQSTVVDPTAEKKINELGRSVTSKKKGDRIPIERACEFHVLYKGLPVKPVLAMTNEEKDEVWKNRESYIGKTIEYKGMLVGSKDVPRHPVFIRFREPKE